jgi:hypothetical protein
VACLGVFSDQVAARGCFGCGEIRNLAVEQAETIMVARREHHVLHSGILRQGDPFRRVVVLRIELICEPCVLLVREMLLVHHPFAASRTRLDRPVARPGIA